ncbi:Acyl-CoA synthetase (AMP-forming)/AMP-acid ligase II [Haloechinothrix alba]|uniref:Acyl-CoA synthetase (AMP-forming)/AMP-acid ligase II n=1 Tax=Haloechinothrix alba TaxID=664784 RepID=A0A239AJ38_9PSEU|nr:AMP-binding protein [Haloechinothrix alba]SNR94943.1 Acyl-CoA synthetase (AMP-forming)/AMP-acid ligase II [Haloechinothrix alba]
MFTDYIDRGVAVNPDGPCLRSADGSVSLDHRQVAALSHRIAASLRNDGAVPGTRIAVYSPNNVTAFLCVLAILRAGATWVAVNPRSEPSELAELLERAEAEILLYDAALSDRADQIMTATPGIRMSVAFDGDSEEQFGRWLVPPGTTVPRLPFDPDAVAMMLGTGGTTGRSKVVPVTNRQFLTMSLAYNAHMPEPTPPIYLLAPPMTHAAGISVWPTLAEGGSVILHDGVDTGAILHAIEYERVTRLFLPPTAIYALLADPGVRDTDVSSLRHFIYAAAPMSEDKLREALEVFGPVMTQTFGQAEAPMIATCMAPADHAEAASDPAKAHRLRSCGRPSLVAAVEIMGDDGTVLGPHERGEIVVRGDLVMTGYHNDPDETAQTRRPGGWHGTSDIGYRDDDGFIYVVDRKRDMIITGGFNVYPSTVERVMWGHSAVLDCAVIGIPDDKWGESVTAVVEPKDDQQITAQELIERCKSELGSVQAPKSVIFRQLPRSANGKVLKRQLRDEYWAGLERRV